MPSKRFTSTTIEIEGREETRVVEIPAFTPEPWGDDASLSIVGTSAVRADGVEKATGRARYTSDVQRTGMLHAVILRSTIASGRIRTLDVSHALSMPGARDVLTTMPGISRGGLPLFDPVIRYAGQPVAAVCADSDREARAALRAIRLTVDQSAHAVTAADALAPRAPRVRGDNENRPVDSPRTLERGDIDRGLADADVVVRAEYRTPVALHTALETHGTVAEWEDDRLTVWEATQGIFMIREHLARAFALPMSHVRVIMQYMGGGFGAKNGAGPHTYVAAAFARRLGRAVRCVNDREAEQMDAGNRPATVQRVTIGAKRDGTLTVIIVDSDVPIGIGGWEGGPGQIYHEVYRCPNVRTVDRYVYINASAMASFRAPGHVEGAFGLERAMDELAHELAIDPLTLRTVNYATVDQKKNRPYSAKHLDRCYQLGAERIGWSTHRSSAIGRDARSSVRRGFGMATQIWGGGGGPPAYATVRINGDGSAVVLSGTQDLGTGARTIFAQIAAEALGFALDQVRVVLGDTERTPLTGNSWGSITTASVGPAVRMAAEDARRSLLEAASELMKVGPAKLEVRDGVVHARTGKKSMPVRAVMDSLGDVMIIGNGSRGPNPDGVSLSAFGAQFAEVEVDMETGIVRVLRIVAAHDSGRIMNPALAESQLHGGIIQGLGYALFEERVMDRALGIPMNPSMHDYKIPTMMDIPEIDAFFVGGVDTTANHTGAKGLAEPPIIPTAPAIANAVADAIGRPIREIPMTPWRVLDAIRAERR
ncbi:MAG: xanthine dehydrogenase family protein molybdopterin-binding subunit [Gemmatimonadota bacterium]|nr:xanthine dehydrogenase family protein molybdopterin-binding subunit [Gemmatimonadota bacterium]